MKDTATIDGVTITREQATKALEEMNTPSVFVPGEGEAFRFGDGRYRRLSVATVEKLIANVKAHNGVLAVNLPYGGISWFSDPQKAQSWSLRKDTL